MYPFHPFNVPFFQFFLFRFYLCWEDYKNSVALISGSKSFECVKFTSKLAAAAVPNSFFLSFRAPRFYARALYIYFIRKIMCVLKMPQSRMNKHFVDMACRYLYRNCRYLYRNCRYLYRNCVDFRPGFSQKKGAVLAVPVQLRQENQVLFTCCKRFSAISSDVGNSSYTAQLHL